jgi:hypothetical protein
MCMCLVQVLTQWAKKANRFFTRRKRKVLIIMDNASSHAVDNGQGVVTDEEEGFKQLKLSHVTMLFLPPNVTSVVQPLDQGVIAALKKRYKTMLLRWQLSEFTRLKEVGKQPDMRQVLPNVKQVCTYETAFHLIRDYKYGYQCGQGLPYRDAGC